jgi:hypothetical protein
MTTHSRPLFDALGTPGSSEVFKPYEGGHANVVTGPDLISDIPPIGSTSTQDQSNSSVSDSVRHVVLGAPASVRCQQ